MVPFLIDKQQSSSVDSNHRELVHQGEEQQQQQIKSWWKNKMNEWVDDKHCQSSTKRNFAIEKLEDGPPRQQTDSFAFEWIEGASSFERKETEEAGKKDAKKIAIRTVDHDGKHHHGPLLDTASVNKIREAAQQFWEMSMGNTESRFTLQFGETNSECHLEDLIALDKSGALKATIDECLLNKIYPLVRQAFGEDLLNRSNAVDPAGTNLCVYDSLVIRYDGNKASDKYGASQPLHRDGGIVSVNIALNSLSEFEGGGTFFEGLIDSPHHSQDPIIRPSDVGHALAHLSTERHAGAPTRSGVREILVFFLTMRPYGLPPRAPPIERAFHLKIAAKEMTQVSQAITCLDMALKERPMDGEAHFWKGFRLLLQDQQEVVGSNDQNDAITIRRIQKSIHHMQRAQECAPFDARIHCFAGMAYKRMLDFKYNRKRTETSLEGLRPEDRMVLELSVECFQNAMYLHEKYQQHGITSDFDVVMAIMSFSEVLTRLEKYEEAVGYIAMLQDYMKGIKEEELLEHVKKHTKELSGYCKDKLSRDCNLSTVK